MSTPAVAPRYLEIGKKVAGKPSLVFLHGIGGRASGWDGVMQRCASNGWHCLAWDMPGYGDSPSVKPYDFAHLARALGDMLEAAHINSSVLIGHSMGGMVAQQYMADSGVGVRAQVLIATTAAFGNGTGEFQQRFLSQRLAPLERGETLLQIAQKLVPSMLTPLASSEVRQAAVDSMGSIAPEAYRDALNALVLFDQRGALNRITIPTLCLAAELDVTAPPQVMSRMSEKVSTASYVCMPGANHLLPFEQPEQLAQVVLNFLEEKLKDE